MARLYSSKRGSSGSTRPIGKKPPAWTKYEPEEVESFVVKLAKEGEPPSVIGVTLRDKHGVPLAKPIVGKKITQILEGAGLKPRLPEDLENLVKRADAMRKHLEKNRKDYPNKRALALIESKIHRLVKYYRARNMLPADWAYKPIAASVA